jgi:hypothetical protein
VLIASSPVLEGTIHILRLSDSSNRSHPTMNSTACDEATCLELDASCNKLQERRAIFVVIFWLVSMVYVAFGFFHMGQRALAAKLKKLTPEKAMDRLLEIPGPFER